MQSWNFTMFRHACILHVIGLIEIGCLDYFWRWWILSKFSDKEQSWCEHDDPSRQGVTVTYDSKFQSRCDQHRYNIWHGKNCRASLEQWGSSECPGHSWKVGSDPCTCYLTFYGSWRMCGWSGGSYFQGTDEVLSIEVIDLIWKEIKHGHIVTNLVVHKLA